MLEADELVDDPPAGVELPDEGDPPEELLPHAETMSPAPTSAAT
jgi:hypothetical protein